MIKVKNTQVFNNNIKLMLYEDCLICLSIGVSAHVHLICFNESCYTFLTHTPLLPSWNIADKASNTRQLINQSTMYKLYINMFQTVCHVFTTSFDFVYFL